MMAIVATLSTARPSASVHDSHFSARDRSCPQAGETTAMATMQKAACRGAFSVGGGTEIPEGGRRLLYYIQMAVNCSRAIFICIPIGLQPSWTSFLHYADVFTITGRSYRPKDQAKNADSKKSSAQRAARGSSSWQEKKN